MLFHGARGVFLGHIISNKGIEVEKVKVKVIKKLPPPTSVKGVMSFLGDSFFTGGSLKIFQKLQNLSPHCLSRMCFSF